MRFFKIRIGYGKEDDRFIQIDESELETALHCFMAEIKGVFKNGVCRGKDIISITEDWHREMGWNPAYQMGPDDWADLEAKGVMKKYVGVIGEVKEKIRFLFDSGQEHLIGRNVSAKELGTSKITLA